MNQHPLISTGGALLSEPERFLRITEVRNQVPLSRAEIYRRMARGEFPRSVPTGANGVAWLQSEIQAWIQETVAKAKRQPPTQKAHGDQSGEPDVPPARQQKRLKIISVNVTPILRSN